MTFATGQSFSWSTSGTGFAHWNRFAAVNDEFVPIHMDDDEGRRAGYPSAIAMGRLLSSYVHRVLRQWLPERGRIAEVSLQFRAPALRGMPFTISVTVSEVRDDGAEQQADLEISIVDGDGRMLAPGNATIAVPLQR